MLMDLMKNNSALLIKEGVISANLRLEHGRCAGIHLGIQIQILKNRVLML